MTVRSQPRRPVRSFRSRSLNLPAFDWVRLLLIVLLIAYWFFARGLERIDGNLVLASFLLPDLTPSQAAAVSLSPWLTTPVEFIHPLVLRHFIPVFVGWWLAVQAAVSLMQVLYNCPDRQTAAEFLRRQRRNNVSAADLPYTVLPGNLEMMREESFLMRVGGPVRVHVPNGYAAVTERNARFLRVLPPGVHDLGRFEYLLGVVDLQAQRRENKDVRLLTREGIPVTTEIALTFCIDRGDEPVSKFRPFPYREDAVREAAYAGAVGANGKVSSWDGSPLGKVSGALAGEVAAHTLDQLLATDDAHQLLTQTVMNKVWNSLPKDGIKPLRLTIGRLTPPVEVSLMYTEVWLAGQRKTELLTRANGTGQLVHDAEAVRAEGEIMMVQAIIQATRRAQQEAGSGVSAYLLIVRLLEALQFMFRHTMNDLHSVGGEMKQLEAEIEATTTRLARLDDTLQLPSIPFNPSSPD